MEKLGIIGSVGAGSVTASFIMRLESQGKEVIVFDPAKPDKFLDLRNDDPLPYVKRPDHVLRAHSEEKPFICKGKHQYTKVNREWVCQCGKKI